MAVDVCVDSCNQSLASGLFIAGGSVDLPCKKQVLHQFRFQCRIELAGIEKVIFDGVTWSEDMYVPECRYRLQSLQLNV